MDLLPPAVKVYYFIKTMTEWKKNKADICVDLLCMENYIEDGTFVGVLRSDLGGCTVIAYTQEDTCGRLTRALRETRRIRWSDQLTFEAVLQKHTTVLHSVAQSKGVETSIYSNSNILYIRNKEAQQLTARCPGDVHVAPLKQCHLPYIHSVWAHNDIYTLRELQMTLTLNGGYGVFSNKDGKLLCWALHTHYGGIGTLQTRSGHNGKGYARLVVNFISKNLGMLGISPHVCIKDSNFKSLSLFRSIGYKHVSSIQYIIVNESLSSDASSS